MATETGSRQSATGARSPPSHARTRRRAIAPGMGGGRFFYTSHFKGGASAPPFVSPTGRKVRGGNTFLVIGAFGGYSLRHASGVTPPSLREAGSHLPVRVLRPGGARPGPTVVATETGSRQSATGARSPPSHARTRRRAIAPGMGGGRFFYTSHFKGGASAPPFVSPTGRKVRGGNTFLVIGAFGGYSLRHAAGVTPPSMREAASPTGGGVIAKR